VTFIINFKIKSVFFTKVINKVKIKTVTIDEKMEGLNLNTYPYVNVIVFDISLCELINEPSLIFHNIQEGGNISALTIHLVC